MNFTVLEFPEELKGLSGEGQTIVADKCDSNWTDKECPNPAQFQEYHFGQFGHKVVFQFCEECYTKTLNRREHGLFRNEAAERGFEVYQ